MSRREGCGFAALAEGADAGAADAGGGEGGGAGAATPLGSGLAGGRHACGAGVLAVRVRFNVNDRERSLSKRTVSTCGS